MILLFITQRLHTQERFSALWIRAFIRGGYDVKVLCLEQRGAPDDLSVYSMGKDRGYSKVRQVLRFWRMILTLKYDRVFIHMSPIWGLLGYFVWVISRTPVYFWYTHYKRSFSARVTSCISKRIFCATEQSVPWLTSGDDSKKVVTGHGIDLDFWVQRKNVCSDPYELIIVHRLSRSKRVEINIRSLLHLPDQYHIKIYGYDAEPTYVAELHQIVEELHLSDRVAFMGTVPMEELSGIYASHRMMLNMASETIDKTMLEAMTCGCYTVTTKKNAEAVGLDAMGDDFAPEEDTPEAVAAFVQEYQTADPDQLYRIVQERHSLFGLITKMDTYIREGR